MSALTWDTGATTPLTRAFKYLARQNAFSLYAQGNTISQSPRASLRQWSSPRAMDLHLTKTSKGERLAGKLVPYLSTWSKPVTTLESGSMQVTLRFVLLDT